MFSRAELLEGSGISARDFNQCYIRDTLPWPKSELLGKGGRAKYTARHRRLLLTAATLTCAGLGLTTACRIVRTDEMLAACLIEGYWRYRSFLASKNPTRAEWFLRSVDRHPDYDPEERISTLAFAALEEEAEAIRAELLASRELEIALAQFLSREMVKELIGLVLLTFVERDHQRNRDARENGARQPLHLPPLRKET